MSSDAWKQVSRGEEAAVYGYGVLAAQFPAGPERNRAIDLATSHARARDRARAALAQADVDPESPAAFEIPFPMDGPVAARRLAALVESRLVDVYCRQIPDLEQSERRSFARMAAEASARSVSWGARPTAFPGGADPETLPSPSGTDGSAPGTPAPGPSGSSGPTPVTSPAAPSPGQGDGAVVQ